jgi:hypothetical protein
MSDKPKTPPSDEKQTESDMPSAGPHATPELTNHDATPGAGSLPDDDDGGDADGGAG